MWQTKTVGAGLEDFVNWTGVVKGKPAEEDEMFSLATGFAAMMSKRSATLEGLERSDLGSLLQVRGLKRTGS